MALVPAFVVISSCGAQLDAHTTLYQLRIEACNTPAVQRATAVAVAPDLLATVAHSFDDAVELSMVDANGEEVTGEVIYLDQAKDLALLRLEVPAANTLELGEPEDSGAVEIATYGESAGPSTRDAEIVELVQATLDGEGPRSAIRLEAEINPGDSGAPVVDAEGLMVGMVFATVRGQERGWAVSAVEISDALSDIAGQQPETFGLTCSS